jgi:hypothetical protein
MPPTPALTPLLDSRPVAHVFAMRREVNRPAPRGDAGGVVLPDSQAYGSVLRDRQGAWRMWYLDHPVYCEYLAVSRDGLVWDRPDLGLNLRGPAPDRARLPGNALMTEHQTDADGRALVGGKGPEGFCVLDADITPHPAARGRFLAMYLAHLPAVAGRVPQGLCLADSDDGIRWRARENQPALPRWWRDTANMFFYDTRLRRYVWYGRPAVHVTLPGHANRLIGRAESEDLVHWSDERIVLDTDDADADPWDLVDELAFRPDRAESRAQIRARITEDAAANADKPLVRGRNRQWYQITVFPVGGLYAGLATLYDIPSGAATVELLHSHDGLDWRREPRRSPFLPEYPGSFMAFMSSPPVPVGDELWLYYSTSGRNHHGVPAPASRAIRVGAIRRDRWVGYVAGDQEGELLTQPLVLTGPPAINAEVQPGGFLKMEVLDPAGTVLEGYAFNQAIPFEGDALAWQPAWSGNPPAETLVGRTVRLRLRGRRARIFALGPLQT